MKNEMKTSGTVLAAVLPCALTLSSCGEQKPAESVFSAAPEQTPVTEAAPAYLDHLPEELDFGGYAVRVFCGKKNGTFNVSSEDTADIVSDLLYRRNRKIEERLNCTLAPVEYEGNGWDVFVSSVNAAVLAGDDTFDMLTGGMWWSTPLTFSGVLYDMAVVLRGYDNVLRNSTLLYLGSGGVSLSGGDKETLTHGNNRAENNLIRDFAQVNQTRAPGIELLGVGNVASHNEICETPHMAVFYSGNEHLIEYNDIHDVVKMSHDAGAVYGGRDVTAHGTVIRYNRLKYVGSEEFHPEGIYWDDALSGQTAFGNVLENVGHWGIEVGGGRENTVRNNLCVDYRGAALHFDERLRAGVLRGGWYKHGDEHIGQLRDCPREGEVWRVRYLLLAKVRTDDGCDPDDIDCFCNPSYGVMRDNIAVSCARLYDVDEAVFRFSDVSDNFLYETAEDAGWNGETGSLRPDSPVYREHPSDPVR